jgi:hypothetical protein
MPQNSHIGVVSDILQFDLSFCDYMRMVLLELNVLVKTGINSE